MGKNAKARDDDGLHALRKAGWQRDEPKTTFCCKQSKCQTNRPAAVFPAFGCFRTRRLAHLLYIIQLYNYTIMNKNCTLKKNAAASLTRRIIVRVTDDEMKEIDENARLCGLTRRAYLRKIIAGKTPKMRMTDEERKAFASFQAARRREERKGVARQGNSRPQGSHCRLERGGDQHQQCRQGY